jgi:hypothetical protein
MTLNQFETIQYSALGIIAFCCLVNFLNIFY